MGAHAARSLLPGIALLCGIGALARFVAAITGINYLIGAIVIGVLVVNLHGVPARFASGVGTYKLWLETGIVVMGARLALDHLLEQGPLLVALVVAVLVGTVLVVELVSRRLLALDAEMGSLMAAGSGVCGVSAVVAVAGSIKANEEQIAYAVATVLLFDVITLFLYPPLGGLLGLADRTFGIWAGISMFSTGPVTAAGFAYSDTAGQWAVLTKLTRNAFIGALAVLYSLHYATRHSTETTYSLERSARQVWSAFPKFVVGMLLVMLFANLVGMTDGQVASMRNTYRWLFLVAFAGLGLNIRVTDIRSAGLRPIAAVLVAFTVTSVGSLSLILLLGL